MSTIVRKEIDGEFQYKAVIIQAGKKLSDTVYSDWFTDDAAARVGYCEIAQDLGFDVLSVNIGEITEVIVK